MAIDYVDMTASYHVREIPIVRYFRRLRIAESRHQWRQQRARCRGVDYDLHLRNVGRSLIKRWFRRTHPPVVVDEAHYKLDSAPYHEYPTITFVCPTLAVPPGASLAGAEDSLRHAVERRRLSVRWAEARPVPLAAYYTRQTPEKVG